MPMPGMPADLPDGHAGGTGLGSSFDLPRLVEDHRYVMKNAPTPSKLANARS